MDNDQFQSNSRKSLDDIAHEFSERCASGETPSVEEYAKHYPDHASEILDLFPALLVMADVATSGGDDEDTFPELEPLQLKVVGDFRIVREIGRGGMGIVYEAEQLSLGRGVALKVLPASRLAGVNGKARFEREAKSAGRLHHPNIVPVFGVGNTDQVEYLVMQLISGLSLDHVIRELRAQRPSDDSISNPVSLGITKATDCVGAFPGSVVDHPFSLSNSAAKSASNMEPSSTEEETSTSGSGSDVYQVISLDSDSESLSSQSKRSHYWKSVARIGRQAAEALHYAHQEGILHRDIKPGNLILDTDNRIWMTDFGLAKVLDAEDLTQTGDVLGTLKYLAPEGLKGEVDERSDVYSLGATLYELASLEPAFQATNRHELIHKVLNEAPDAIRRVAPEIPQDLATVIEKSMSREPNDRYESARELSDDLQRFLNGVPIQARRIGAFEQLVRWSQRNKTVATLMSAIAVGIFAVAIGASIAAGYFRSMSTQLTTTVEKLEDTQFETQKRETILSYQRGRDLVEQDSIAEGLGWMLEAMSVCPEEMVDYGQMIRMNLSAWSRLLPEPLEQDPGTTRVRFNGIAYCATRDMFTYARKQTTLHFISAKSGEAVFPPVEFPHPIDACAVSDDGKQLAVALRCENREVHLLELNDLTKTHAIAYVGKHSHISRLKWHPDNERLLSCFGDRFDGGGTLFVLNTAGEQVVDPQEVDSRSGIDFSPDGKLMLGLTPDLLWDADTIAPIGDPFDVGDAGTLAKFHPDGETVYIADPVYDEKQQTIRQVGIHTRTPILQKIVEGRNVHEFLTKTPDERQFIFNSYSSVNIGETDEDAALMLLAQPASTKFEIDSAGRQLVTEQFRVRLPRAISRRLNPKSTNRVIRAKADFMDRNRWMTDYCASRRTAITKLPLCGRELAQAGNTLEYAIAQLWDVDTGQPKGRPLVHAYHRLVDVSISRDGSLAATAAEQYFTKESAVYIWDGQTGERLIGPLPFRFVTIVEFSPDGKSLAIGTHDGEVHFRDTSTGKALGNPIKLPTAVWEMAFSEDGKYLAVGGQKGHTQPGSIRVLDASSHEDVVPPLTLNEMHPVQLAWIPNQKQLVCIDAHTAWLWDWGKNEEVGLRRDHANVLSIVADSDGKRLAVGLADGGIQLFDTNTISPIAQFQQPSGSYELAFSPNGKLLTSSGDDGGVRIWDVASGEILGPPFVQKTTAHRVAWLPTGEGVVTTARDGTTRVWPLAPAPTATEAELRELIQIRTQRQVGEGATLNAFTIDEWNTRREQAISSGLMLSEKESARTQEGMPKLVPPVDDRLLHEHRARDAEQDRDWFGAQWYLDRLIDGCQRESESSENKTHRWLLLARRARTYSERGNLDAAANDYAAAREHLSNKDAERLTIWYRHRAVDCLRNNNLNLGIWYLGQVIGIDCSDWQDYAMRAEFHKRLKNSEMQKSDEEHARLLSDDPLYIDGLLSTTH